MTAPIKFLAFALLIATVYSRRLSSKVAQQDSDEKLYRISRLDSDDKDSTSAEETASDSSEKKIVSSRLLRYKSDDGKTYLLPVPIVIDAEDSTSARMSSSLLRKRISTDQDQAMVALVSVPHLQKLLAQDSD